MKGALVLRFAVVVMSILLAACSVFGVRNGTEEPRYAVAQVLGPIEVRAYGPRIAAETTVGAGELAARSTGFSRLAGYIFGANTSRARIAMTAPVAQSSEKIAMTAPVAQARDPSGQWTIRFFMPADRAMADLPAPNDPAVRLVDVPAETMAVLRFAGSTAANAVAAKREDLLRALAGTAWQAAGEPVSWFYDPPWTLPWLRRNEVAVRVQPA